MPSLPLAGPTYQLRDTRAAVDRCVNWVPVQIESGTGKGGAAAYLKQVPGKAQLCDLGAPVRGIYCADGVLDGYGIFAEPGQGQWYLSVIGDFTELGALDFATAEGTPGPIVAHIVKHRELLILQERTGEVWYDAGGADFPFARNTGAVLEVGCAAAHSLCA